MPLNKGNTKTPGADSSFQKMTNKPKRGKQDNGESIYEKEGWKDDPSLEGNDDDLQRLEKQRQHAMMLQSENKKKKLGLGKWGRKK